MAKEEILIKAMRIATNNGWERPKGLVFRSRKEFCFISSAPETFIVETYAIRSLLLDIEFAKALWGDDMGINIRLNGNGSGAPKDSSKPATLRATPNYQHHLQQMVISEDSIAYLAEHMPEDN